MKPYYYILILVLLVLFAHTMEYNELEEECFTDSCLCVNDCLDTKGE